MTTIGQADEETSEANFNSDREKIPVFPPDTLDELLELSRFIQVHTEPGFLVGPDGEKTPLSAEVYEVLRQVIEAMRRGRAILVSSQGLFLTTQEAADFLGVSRPTLVKLLEEGTIAFEKPNRHRRVRLQDLVDFQQRRRIERKQVLNQLTEEASELGLYDGSPDDYKDALREVRQRRSQSDHKA
ncbi:helix-turn-helix domain-containing protein [Acidithrix sp. C25]|uniref:helix-turn-helix domain-containing protein n=1 Tax=Acidithrix sp. C25 TaxID=1671482 RepID=UPI00191BACC5|nr:helix-turn-helix domain-containing protein [Acidithrix sp. C25]CAG4932557.1 unnamed protein product [Acidithrix sp. C25]